MRVEYQLTFDDAIYVHQRMYELRHYRGKAWLRRILATGTCFAFASAARSLGEGQKPATCLIIAAFNFVAGAGFAIAMGMGVFGRDHINRKSLRKEIQGDGPFPCVVTIDESGVESTQLDVSAHHAWSDVEFVDDCELGVEINFLDGHLLLVRFTGFEWPERKEAFLEEAQRFFTKRSWELSQDLV